MIVVDVSRKPVPADGAQALLLSYEIDVLIMCEIVLSETAAMSISIATLYCYGAVPLVRLGMVFTPLCRCFFDAFLAAGRRQPRLARIELACWLFDFAP